MNSWLMSLSIGLISGLFVNTLSDVLPFYRKISKPVCNSCGKPLGVIPFLLLKDCTYCHQRKRLRSLVIILIYIALTYWVEYYPVRLNYWLSIILLIYFGVITVIDIEYRVILNETILIGAVLTFLIGLSYHTVQQTVIGGAAGFIIMLGFYFLGILIQKFRSRQSSVKIEEEALGFGDVNLMGVLGLLLGWPAVIVGLFFGVITAGLFSVIVIFQSLLQKKYQSNMAIPYGPFLILGAFLLLYLYPR